MFTYYNLSIKQLSYLFTTRQTAFLTDKKHKMKVFSETNKTISQLKDFESALLGLRHNIRSIKYSYKRDMKKITCPKLKNSYKEKIEKYTVKEFNAFLHSIEANIDNT